MLYLPDWTNPFDPSYNLRFSAFGKCWAWGPCGFRRRRGSLRTTRQSEIEDIPMKQGIHPNYREVCFVDLSNGFKFVTRSCVQSKETVKMDDGRELPLVKLETTSETHPFYTGTQKSVDSLGGRVRRFRHKFARVGLQKQ